MCFIRRLTHLVFLAVVIGLAGSGCDVLDPNTEVDASDSANDPPKAINEVTKTVGPNGGMLEVDGMVFNLPAGALDSPVRLKLARVGDVPDILGDDAVTRSYTVTGLPVEFSLPIELSLAVEGVIEDSSYIVVGMEGLSPSTSESKRTYELLPAAAEDSLLVARLPVVPFANEAGGKRLAAGFLEFFGVSKYRTIKSSAGHFSIRYPKSTVQRGHAETLGGHLEDAYSAHQDVGLSFSGRTRWPVEVEIVKLDRDTDGLFVPSYRGDNYSTLQFNRTNLDNPTELRTTAGHELLHLVQYLYDTRWAFTKKKFPSRFQWLNEATAVWCEEGMSGQPGYTSPIVSGREMAPFHGIQSPAESGDPNEHGYGMASFVKYLVDKYDKTLISDWYDRIKAGAHPVHAINSSIDHKLVLEWEPYLRKYATGDIYDVQPARFLNSAWDSFVLKTLDDTLKVFSDQYPDLSARIYSIYFHRNLPDLTETASLRLKIDKDLADLTAFIYDGSADPPMIFHSHSLDSLTISDLKGLQEDNKRIVVLVSNTRFTEPYTNQTPIKLAARVVEIPRTYKAHVEWSVHASPWKVTDSSGNSWETGNTGPWSVGSLFYDYSSGNLEEAGGQWHFQSGWSSTPEYTSASGMMNMRLDKDLSRVDSYRAKYVASSNSGSINVHVEGGRLPAVSGDLTERVFEVTGPATCNNLNQSALVMESSNFLGLRGEMIDFYCDQDSYVRITLQAR